MGAPVLLVICIIMLLYVIHHIIQATRVMYGLYSDSIHSDFNNDHGWNVDHPISLKLDDDVYLYRLGIDPLEKKSKTLDLEDYCYDDLEDYYYDDDLEDYYYDTETFSEIDWEVEDDESTRITHEDWETFDDFISQD